MIFRAQQILCLLLFSTMVAFTASAQQALPTDQITARAKNVSEAIATAKRCKWSSPLSILALERARLEMDNEAGTYGDAAVTAFTNGLVQGEMAGRIHPCTDTALKN